MYRRLLASAAWRRFALTAGLQRLSVAMARIAFVLAAHGAIGSFRVGALMASAYTLADAIASPWLGRFIDRMELRRGLSLELGAAAVVLAALAGLTAGRVPAPALIVLSALAGAERPATAGLLIALLSLASAAGGFAYGPLAAHLPGGKDQRANAALVAPGLCSILIAVSPSLPVLALAVAARGIWFAPLNTLRTLILGELLPGRGPAAS